MIHCAMTEKHESSPPPPLGDDAVVARLEWLIKHLGTSARALSLKAGLTHTQVTQVLNRGSGGAQVDTLRKIAVAAGCNFAWLIDGQGDPFGERVPPRSGFTRRGDTPGFDRVLADAKLASRYPSDHEVWSEIANSEPLTDESLTVASVVELADWIVRHKARKHS